MAVVAVIVGGLFGFASFLAALLIFDLGFLPALGIYSGSGVGLTLVILAMAHLAQALSAKFPLHVTRSEAPSKQF